MTYPVPDRLAPIRRKAQLLQGVAAMFAVLALVLAVFAGFGAHVGDLSSFDLACFALASLALHFVWTVPVRRP